MRGNCLSEVKRIMAKLCEVNKFLLAREREAELAYVRYLIERDKSQLAQVRTDQGIKVPAVFSSVDESLAKAAKAGKEVETGCLKQKKGLKTAERRTAVRKANVIAKRDKPPYSVEHVGALVIGAQASGRGF